MPIPSTGNPQLDQHLAELSRQSGGLDVPQHDHTGTMAMGKKIGMDALEQGVLDAIEAAATPPDLAALQAHVADVTTNPHDVTAAQVGSPTTGDVNTALAAKADASAVYTKTEVDDAITAATSSVLPLVASGVVSSGTAVNLPTTWPQTRTPGVIVASAAVQSFKGASNTTDQYMVLDKGSPAWSTDHWTFTPTGKLATRTRSGLTTFSTTSTSTGGDQLHTTPAGTCKIEVQLETDVDAVSASGFERYEFIYDVYYRKAGTSDWGAYQRFDYQDSPTGTTHLVTIADNLPPASYEIMVHNEFKNPANESPYGYWMPAKGYYTTYAQQSVGPISYLAVG